ncbi:hypothetical protein LINPERPRIM_LOCUS31669 [Linum perenne]
MLLDN